jgi:adenylate cyclase
MTEERAHRKLSGILSADAAGYSRLMRQDEAVTVATLKAHKEVMAALIERYRGRIVDSPGDNLLAEFGSVVDAVECAVEIQKALKAKNDALPDDRKMAFRLGIHLGDVLEEEDRIYGDGVNIAARIEGLAEPGGICISRTTYDSVKDKLSLGYAYLGAHSVKNIAEPVRVYRVLTEPEAAGKVIGEKRFLGRFSRRAALATILILAIVAAGVVGWNLYLQRSQKETPASIDKMAYPLPDKPSIAVLPFDNLSGDPEQDFFSDALTEQIISSLSRVPRLFVIARNSTFVYRGKPVKIQQVAEDLGVKYVLEGSAQKSGDRVRITAQLIDAITGRHIWSESYDRTLDDLFELQDEIALEIVRAMQVKLTEGEQALIWKKGGTDNIKAFLKALEAVTYVRRFNIESNAMAHKLSEEAIAMDPDYAMPYTILASAHIMDVWLGTSRSRADSLKTAHQLLQKSLDLEEALDLPHAFLGFLYNMMGEFDRAIEEGERAIELNPNSADAYAWLSISLRYSGRLDDALISIQKAMRLSPFPPSLYLLALGNIYRDSGMYAEAITAYEKVVARQADDMFAHIGLASSYLLSGKDREARMAAAEVLRINPKFSVAHFAETLQVKDQAIKSRFIDSLRKAGLPEHPPLQLPEKPSIAVLAFDNLSGDPEQDYFGDGLAEEIITALSKSNDLFVIARNSSFTYKGKPVKVQQVAKELGVRYVLEGSFKRSGDRLRVTALLIDAPDGKNLWAERYDRKLSELFEIQDDITKQIIASLKVKLTIGEAARIYAKGTNNLDAYLKVMQAWNYHMRFTKADNDTSRELAEEGIAMDPQYGNAYVLLAATYMLDTYLGDPKNRQQNLAKAIEIAKQAVALEHVGGYAMLGWLYSIAGQNDKALAECKKAVELEPNSAAHRVWYGAVLYRLGRYEAAIQELEQAVWRDPMAGTWVLRFLGGAYSFAGQHDEAIATLKKAIQKAPNDYLSRLFIIRAYIFADRQEEAEAEAAEVLRLNPKFSLEDYAKTMTEKDRERSLEAYRRAGLK